MSERRPVEVLGVRFDAVDRATAAKAVVALARSGGKHYVVKPYSEFLPRAHRDDRVCEILNGADLCLADGAGILWAAHYLSLRGGRSRALIQLPLSLASLLLRPAAVRTALPEAMHGVDLTWEMLAAAESAKLRVYLLGGTRKEVEGTAASIAARLPKLKLVGYEQGHIKRKGPANDAAVAAINAVAPDLLLVAMGFPRQEQWIASNLGRLNVRVAVAEGGSFTFMSGATRRAPAWMQRSGLEWLFRLVRQPWRFRRQLALPRFVWLVVRERLGRA
jgi:N-acetylglucosaminyldiphosphoundecaprenol N-acetyl-beta-D-mannosaminyltransferase